MAIGAFIFQGLTETTHEEVLGKMLHHESLENATFSVAFVRRSGVRLLQSKILPIAKKVKVFAGIRNPITSYQGLELLLDLGANVYCVDVGQVRRIFHPKIYVSKCADTTSLMVGSANLTSGGLIENIESSLFLRLNIKDVDDLNLSNEAYQCLHELEVNFPENVFKLSNKPQLLELLELGLVADERIKLSVPVGTSNKGNVKKTVPAINLKTKKKPQDQPSISESVAALKASLLIAGTKTFENYVEVWRSKPLKPSNINITTSSTANKKGVLSLGQGGMNGKGDFQNYFRNEVFGKLTWSPVIPKGTYEAEAQFEVRIGGVFIGTYNLRIRFSEAKKTVQQNNVTTRLVWGELLQFISSKEYLKRIVYLSRHVGDPKQFLLEID